MAQPRTRVPGSGFTVMTWQGKVIGMIERLQVQAVRPVADAEPIQPINAIRPIEIVTAGAHGPGTLILSITELYGQSIWQQFPELAQSQDIADVMRTVAALDPNNGIKVQRVIVPPFTPTRQYVETYFNCVVTDLPDSETVDVTTVRIEKDITVMYTHSSKSWINGGRRANQPNGFNSQFAIQ
jgi:hypothetical protein